MSDGLTTIQGLSLSDITNKAVIYRQPIWAAREQLYPDHNKEDKLVRAICTASNMQNTAQQLAQEAKITTKAEVAASAQSTQSSAHSSTYEGSDAGSDSSTNTLLEHRSRHDLKNRINKATGRVITTTNKLAKEVHNLEDFNTRNSGT